MAEGKTSQKVEKIAKDIETLTALELSELSEHLEKKFGVSAMPVAAATQTAQSTSAEATADKEEKSVFTVVLSASGDNKLAVIKVVREINQNLGLMEAKKLVELTPQELLKDVKKEEAQAAKKKLEEAGAKVELR